MAGERSSRESGGTGNARRLPNIGNFLPTRQVLNPAVFPDSMYAPITIRGAGEFQPIDKAGMLRDLMAAGIPEVEILRLMDGGLSSVAQAGRVGNGVKDTRLAHINPAEDRLLRAFGGSGSINPNTGLPEYRGGGGGSSASGRDTGGPGGGSRAGPDRGRDNGGRDGGMRAPAGTGNAGYSSGGSVGGGTRPKDSDALDGFKGVLGGLLGYNTHGDLRTAYNNNPSAPHNRNHTGVLPSFPNASPVYAAASLLDAPMGPVGWAGMGLRLGDVINGGTGDGIFGGLARDAGYGPGPRGPDVGGGGYDRGGQGGALNGQGLLGLPNPAQSPGLLSGTPTGTSAPQPQTPPSGLLTMEYPGQTVPIGGPTPYSYYRPPYNYYGR